MAFAICYEFGDLAALAGTLSASSLPAQLRNEARRYLNGGLDQWDVAPLGVVPGEHAASCPECRILTCSYGTLVAFIQLLRDVSAHFVSQGTATEATRYFLALADDLEGDESAPTGANSSGREPYP
jgi:hypothetical protein